jgi:hypothetical protein
MHERIVCELWEGVIFYDDHPDWACNKAQTGLPSLLRFAMVSKVFVFHCPGKSCNDAENILTERAFLY